MNKQIKTSILILPTVLTLIALACQSTLAQPTATLAPTSTPPPTATSIPPTVTFTPTPVTEEDVWRSKCNAVQERGQIGEGVVNHISYSSDGKLAAISAGGGVALYNLEEQSRTWFYPTDRPIKQSVFIDNDNEFVSLDEENRIILFDAKRGKINTSTDPVDAMGTRLSEDGSMVMLADWLGVIYTYDTTNFNLISSTEEYIHKNETVTLFMSDLIYSDILFSPDSKLIMTAAFTGRITFFNAKTGNVSREYPLEERAFPSNSSFSGNSKYVAIEYHDENQKTEVRILNVNSGFLKQIFQGSHPALSKDGTLLATWDQGRIMIWQVSNGTLLNEFDTAGDLMGNLKFGFENSTLLAALETGVNIWNLDEGTLTGVMEGYFSNYKQIATSKNSAIIVLRTGDHIEIRNVENGELITKIPTEEDISYIALNEEGTQLAGVANQEIIVWDLTNGTIVQKLKSNDALDFIAFTANPNEFITGDLYSGISLVAFENGKPASKTEKKVELSEFASTFAGDLVATVSSNNIISLIDPLQAKFIKTIRQDDRSVGKIALAPSGLVLAFSTSDRKINIWNTAGAEICTLDNQPEYVSSLAFSSDGFNLYILPQESGYVQKWGIAVP